MSVNHIFVLKGVKGDTSNNLSGQCENLEDISF